MAKEGSFHYLIRKWKQQTDHKDGAQGNAGWDEGSCREGRHLLLRKADRALPVGQVLTESLSYSAAKLSWCAHWEACWPKFPSTAGSLRSQALDCCTVRRELRRGFSGLAAHADGTSYPTVLSAQQLTSVPTSVTQDSRVALAGLGPSSVIICLFCSFLYVFC